MRMIQKIKVSVLVIVFTLLPVLSYAANDECSCQNKATSMVVPQLFEQAKKNENWKIAVATGKHAQVVFMNITPVTNPKNEVGMETHPFDQVIFVIEGKAKTDLNGKTSEAKEGDMIFVPQGVAHNIINMHANKPLKIMSVYSSMDIPANAVYKKKSDSPE
ncbi:MAG: cupin domain-containing protein [Gammaproteobacteria bacterium]